MSWYPDPTGRAALRLEENGAWTSWVSDGRRSWQDPRPVRRPLGPADAPALAFVTDVLLPEAWAAGALDPARAPRLDAVVEMLRAETRVGPAPAPAPVPQPVPAANPQPMPEAAPAPQPVPVPGPPPGPVPAGAAPAPHPAPSAPPSAPPYARPAPRAPRAVPAWRRALAASLATHGLTYLGVLLLFVGVFGLVAFAFGDVRPALRPVAELTAAAVPFAAAWHLRRAGASDVARALVVLGGLLVPLLLVTAFVDGAPIPPDPRGTPLVVGLTLVPLACAAAYHLRARREPATALRHAVVPALVLAAAMATIAVGRPLPAGQDVAEPSAWQVGAMALVLAVAAVAASARGRDLGPSVPVTLVVVTVLAVLTWSTGEPAAWLVLATGASLVVALLATRAPLPRTLPGVVAPVVWGVTSIVAAGADGVLAQPGPLGVAAALGFLVLVEEAGRRGRAVVVLGLSLAGLGVATLGTAAEPWATTALCAALTAWALVRRVRPSAHVAVTDAAASRTVRGLLGTVGALAPAYGLAALGAATRPTVGLAAAVAVLAVARVPALRTPGATPPARPDTYWRTWWRAGAALVVMAVPAVQVWAAASAVALRADTWVPVGVLVALAVLVVRGPVPLRLRLWTVASLATWAWFTVAVLAELPAVVTSGVLVAAGLVLVVVARPSPLVAVGSTVLAVAVLPPALAAASARLGDGAADRSTTWAFAAVLAAAAAACALQAVRTERSSGGSGTAARVLWLAAAAAVPATILVTIHAVLDGVGREVPGWCAAVLCAGWALVLAAATRLVRPDAAGGVRLPAGLSVAPWSAGTFALLAVALRWTPERGWWSTTVHDRWLDAAVLGVVAVVPPLLASRCRPRVLVGAGWAVVPLLVLSTSGAASAWVREHPAEALVLAAASVGATYLLGVAAVSPRRAWPTRRAARPPLVVGTALLGVAAACALGLPHVLTGTSGTRPGTPLPSGLDLPTVLGPLLDASVLAGVACALGVYALRCRAPWHVTAALLAAWAAVVRTWPEQLVARPWLAVLAAAFLALGAEATCRRAPRARRRHTALLVAAAPVALTALTGDVREHLAVGGLAVVVAVVLARRGARTSADVVAAGGTLVVALALTSGVTAPAVAAALGALAATVLALITREARRGRVGAAAGGVAWVLALLAATRTAQESADLSLAVGAVTATLTALAWLLAARRRDAGPASDADGIADDAAPLPAALLQAWWLVGIAVATLGAALVLGPATAGWVAATAGLVLVVGLLVGALAWHERRVLDLAAVTLALAALAACAAAGTLPTARVLALALLAAALAVLAAWLSAPPTVVLPEPRTHAVPGRQGGTARPTARVVAHVPHALAVGSLAALAAALGVVVDVAAGAPAETVMRHLAALTAAVAVQLGAWGVARRSLAAQVLSPLAAALAWLVLAPSLTDDSLWWTAPLGLALLVDAALVRRDRRARADRALPPRTAAAEASLELLGTAFLVGPAVVRSVEQSVAWAAPVLLVGALLFLWGAVAKVRRRLVLGTATVLVATVLLVGVPLVAAVPAWGDAAAWLVVAGVGVAAVVGATALERGRAAVSGLWRRIGADGDGWE